MHILTYTVLGSIVIPQGVDLFNPIHIFFIALLLGLAFVVFYIEVIIISRAIEVGLSIIWQIWCRLKHWLIGSMDD